MTRPGVGTGVWIRKDGKVLVGKRQGTHGAGTWGAAGGKVEMNEELIANCLREVKEESGLVVENVKFMTFTNDIVPEWGTHYLTLHFAADWVSGEPVEEPGGMGDWGWYSWDELPEPLFPSARNFVETGYNPLNFN